MPASEVTFEHWNGGKFSSAATNKSNGGDQVDLIYVGHIPFSSSFVVF